MKANVTHHDGSDLYSNQGEYSDQDTTIVLDGGVVKIDIGHLATLHEGEPGEPEQDFIGVTIELDLVNAEVLYEQLGDILYVLPEEERAENI